MGIPLLKLALYTALGGVRPSAEYADLLHEFMAAVKQNYGEKVLVQFEDFANHNGFELLEKYGSTHLVFNDDIQGTTSVVLAGLIAVLKLLGSTLAEHTFLFFGARETKAPLEEMHKKIWLVDSKGLIISSCKNSLQHFKKPWAPEHEPVKDLLDAVKAIKPTVLIGSSGVERTFTKEVIEAMASFNEKPLIMGLSNPTSQSNCTAEEAYTWSQGHAIFASGSPFDPMEYNGKVFVPGQANNAYIFPGFGLGLVISGAIRVHDEMLLAAKRSRPTFAADVAAKEYELGELVSVSLEVHLVHLEWEEHSQKRNLSLWLSPTQPRNLSAQLNKLTPGVSDQFRQIMHIFSLDLVWVWSSLVQFVYTMKCFWQPALAEQVTKENLDKGLIYPPFSNIRKISDHIAANVAAKAYELGLATRLPRPDNLVKYAESCMYTPNYRSFR
ncbi:hypothetical protein ACSBR1_039138 [Camellia fascicularis]